MTTISDIIAKQAARIERLESYIRSQALCPCCEEYEECVSECTLHDDCYDESQRMNEARRVLRGEFSV
jgi:hypothetical protein